jgi:hypothetical protein
MATVNYRSITSKLTQLYCLSLTEGNGRLLKYHEDRYKRDGKILDICDGTQVIFHQQKMADNFSKFRREVFDPLNPGKVIDECSLGLTCFYDGATNFKRSADSMWPLITSVINCNPSNRTKMGIGASLTFLHNMSGSNVETFLMELYAKELKHLEKGMVFVVAGDSAAQDRYVYLQARLMFMHLDTKALESKMSHIDLFPSRKMETHLMRFPCEQVPWSHVTNEEYCRDGRAAEVKRDLL